MSDGIKCIKCGSEIPADQVKEPTYRVRMTGLLIQPPPKCAPCREAHEAKAVGLDKVAEG